MRCPDNRGQPGRPIQYTWTTGTNEQMLQGTNEWTRVGIGIHRYSVSLDR